MRKNSFFNDSLYTIVNEIWKSIFAYIQLHMSLSILIIVDQGRKIN